MTADPRSNRPSMAFPVVISGPSGVGKTTLVDALVDNDPLLSVSVSTTTRAPRDGEVTGQAYFFVEPDVFEKLKERELIEYAEVHGEYYGTPRRYVDDELAAGADVVLNIDVQGGISVKKHFPNAVMVFILPPSFETLEERMRKRGATESVDIATRLENARKEIKASNHYDYLIINDDLTRAVGEVRGIIEAERCRRTRQKPEFLADFK